MLYVTQSSWHQARRLLIDKEYAKIWLLQAHFLEGRKMARRQNGARWIDTYKVPDEAIMCNFCCSALDQTLSPQPGANQNAAVSSV